MATNEAYINNSNNHGFIFVYQFVTLRHDVIFPARFFTKRKRRSPLSGTSIYTVFFQAGHTYIVVHISAIEIERKMQRIFVQSVEERYQEMLKKNL